MTAGRGAAKAAATSLRKVESVSAEAASNSSGAVIFWQLRAPGKSMAWLAMA